MTAAPFPQPSAEPTAQPTSIIGDVACPHCGCLCDDSRLTVRGNQIVAADACCEVAGEWFLQPRPTPHVSCWIDGQPARLENGIVRAAELLGAAKCPLAWGLGEAATDTQRAAVALADAIGAVIDTPASTAEGPAGWTFRGVGDVTCSLGEVKNRGDVILFWGADPATTQPRHLERYSLFPAGSFVPDGRAGRTCVVIDTQKTKTAELAEQFVPLPTTANFEAIWILRALAAGIEVSEEQAASTGQPISVWRDVLARLKGAKYGVIFFGPGVFQGRNAHATVDAIRALARDLNQFTRCVCLALRDGGNGAGAANVLTWQTGYPMAVNLARGFPRFGPGEYSAEAVLSRGEADAAVVIGRAGLAALSAAARERLTQIPVVSLAGDDVRPTARGVTFATSVEGIHTGGTVYRSDGVSLPLRPVLTSPLPAAREILHGILKRITSATA